MNRLLLSVLCFVVPALAGPSGAEEAYKKLAAAPPSTRTASSLRAFLAAHPGSARCGAVRLWLGDALASTHPREALRAYQRSNHPAAAGRAADLAFRHEAPPALAVERWIGKPFEPARIDGFVKVIVFFSVTHPQTRKLLPWLRAKQASGLRMAGVASVVDDYRAQQPDALARRVRELALPFPVAIDRQQGKVSASLQRYRGACVPWAVLIDRYGRVAWAGGIDARAATAARMERRVRQLLAQPPYERLTVKQLTTIKTVTAAHLLTRALERPLEPRLRQQVQEILRLLMPTGRNAARGRALRYSFAKNRLVLR